MNDLGLSPFVSDGMIIQRDAPFPIFAREKISVNFLGKTYSGEKQESGRWRVTLDPVQAGGPYAMEIVHNDITVNIKDIYAGDVWLCSGQSNMEMLMDRVRDNFSEEWLNTDFPLVRQFKVPQEWDFSSPREELTGGSWLCPSADTLTEFSAAAWFFAKELYKKHGVPIGLISTAWGGTPIESWMSRDALVSFPEKIAEGEQYADAALREKTLKDAAAGIQEWEINLSHEDTGIAKAWQNPQTDISGWDDISLPCDFSNAGLEKFCGVIWLAKNFEADEDFSKSSDIKVWLGTIVDSDTAYINGTEIGNTAYRYPPRKYAAKSLIKQGTNRIVIRVICNNGEGGFEKDKPFRIFTENASIELSGKWKYKIGAKAAERPQEFFFQRMPMGNFNAMIAPVFKYPLKGVIWYQGESNDPNAREYGELFKNMIQDWRGKSGNEHLPFLFVQLPIFGVTSDNNENDSWAIIREGQAAALSLPATGMACALELGEWNDIHPMNKKDVGIRLFLAAEKLLFNSGNTSPGPMLCRHEKKAEKLFMFFENCGEGLSAVGNEGAYAAVIDGDKTVRLPIKIESADSISIDLSSLSAPKKILYAWAINPRDRQLVNSEGLPAIPFKIESGL